MERVAFLIEESGERIPCLLNPESVVVRRLAGVQTHRLRKGALTGAGLADDRLIFTGGGRTEIDLDLLFDVSLAGSPPPSDIRELTAPLWSLSENSWEEGASGRPPLVRFVWGKSWNVPGVVVSVAERLEYFTPDGFPRRSWLRLRLLRVAEPPPDRAGDELTAPQPLLPASNEPAPELVRIHELGGSSAGAGDAPPSTEPLYSVAARYYGHPGFWKILAAHNGIDDPLHLNPGQTIQVPPLTEGLAE